MDCKENTKRRSKTYRRIIGHSVPLKTFEQINLNTNDQNRKNVVRFVDKFLPDHSEMTPLHLTSKMGQMEICKLLCKYVPNKNILDSDGKTPIDLAVSVRKWNIVSFLKNSRNPVKNYKIN